MFSKEKAEEIVSLMTQLAEIKADYAVEMSKSCDDSRAGFCSYEREYEIRQRLVSLLTDE